MPRILPVEIKAGISFELTVEHAGYPAPDWTLRLLLRGPGSIDLTSVDAGTVHRLSATAAVSSGWQPGEYAYSLRASRGAEVVELESGAVPVRPDLAAAAPGADQRVHARKVLAAIEAVIEGRATLDQERYRIGERELYRTPIADLLKLRSHYRAELARETAAVQGYSGLLGREVQVRC